MPPHRVFGWSYRVVTALAFFVIPLATTSVAVGGAPGDDKHASTDGPPNAELRALDPYLGLWDVTETHFDARGVAGALVTGNEEVVWILDRHAIRRTYHTRTDVTAFEAIGLLTWSDGAKNYVGVWLNNMSTAGSTTVEGEWSSDHKSMVFTLDSRAKDGSAVRYRVVDEWPDEKRHVATTYRIDGEKIIKLMVVHYVRSKPCPGGPRIIFDEIGGRP